MDTPFVVMKRRLANGSKQDSPFEGLPDFKFIAAVIGLLHSMPTDRLREMLERLGKSASAKDRYEAHELAIVLFAQEELGKLPGTVSTAEAHAIMKEMIREAMEHFLSME